MKIETAKRIQELDNINLERATVIVGELESMINNLLPEEVEDKDNEYYYDIERAINISLGRFFHKEMFDIDEEMSLEDIQIPEPKIRTLMNKYIYSSILLEHIGESKYKDDKRAKVLFDNAAKEANKTGLSKDLTLRDPYRKYYMDYSFKCDLIDVAKESDDLHTQVGAIIADGSLLIESGTNTMPKGTSGLPLGREGDYLDTKYPYIVHAEANAILAALKIEDIKLEGATMYVTLFPCNECAKMIIQSGITEVVYWEKKYKDKDFIKAAETLFEVAGITVRKFGIFR